MSGKSGQAQYEGIGYAVMLRSDLRGYEVFRSDSFVGATGFRDLELVGQLVKEISWRFGNRDGLFCGICTCSILDIEHVTQLTAFRQWRWQGISTFAAFIGFCDGIYILLPKSRIDLEDLANGELLTNLYFFPRFPDTSIVLKVDDEATMFFVYDQNLETLSHATTYSESIGLQTQFVGNTRYDLRSMEDMVNISSIKASASKWMASSSYVDDIPLSPWYEYFLGRFMEK